MELIWIHLLIDRYQIELSFHSTFTSMLYNFSSYPYSLAVQETFSPHSWAIRCTFRHSHIIPTLHFWDIMPFRFSIIPN